MLLAAGVSRVGSRWCHSFCCSCHRYRFLFLKAIALDDVLITGLGIVSPLGIGRDRVWAQLESGRSGVSAISDYAAAGWLAPFGGQIADFDPKQYVKPRKSLKVMAREIQFAFAAAELATTDAGFDPETEAKPFDPERAGVVLGAGTMYCDPEELVDSYRPLAGKQSELAEWGQDAARNLFPLWMLKYLPNMPACHIGIRQDARGPTNTIAHGDVSSLLAIDEAVRVIQRGHADVMFVGGTSSRLAISDLLWHGGERLAKPDKFARADPQTICRPFDADRTGMVMGEGAAMFVLESAAHAKRRKAKPMARIASIVSRSEAIINKRMPPSSAIENALAAAMTEAKVKPTDLSHINAHGLSTLEDDPAEASAIARVLAGQTVPVTAPKSYTGNLGAGSGAVELAISLLAHQHGVVPATLNHGQTDPQCPIEVATEMHESKKPIFATLNHSSTGQAVAAIVVASE